MNRTVLTASIFSLLASLNVTQGVTQSSQSSDKLAEQAEHEFLGGNFRDAERDFRELTKLNQSDIIAHLYLGHALFRQEKYCDAVHSYEKARELEQGGIKLSEDQHRILVDQLAMAYGVSRDLKKAQRLLEDAIQKDPRYPMNYYNLACYFAEQGDKTRMLTNLSLAFQHRDHILKGESMPNPRTDPSFQKYLHDDDFVSLMKKLNLAS